MSTQHAPQRLHPAMKKEPIGWDFTDVRFLTQAIDRAWFFIPWANTKALPISATAPPGERPKLLYDEVRYLAEEHLGSGIVLDSDYGSIVGCYKVYADTEAGDETKGEIAVLKMKLDAGERDLLGASEEEEAAEGRRRFARVIKSYKANDGEENGVLAIPNEIRRLNGLMLDPRPARIALHQEMAYAVHPEMEGVDMNQYGERYAQLEWRIRAAMENTFNEQIDLPIYRQEQTKAAIKEGRPEPDFKVNKANGAGEEDRVSPTIDEHVEVLERNAQANPNISTINDSQASSRETRSTRADPSIGDEMAEDEVSSSEDDGTEYCRKCKRHRTGRFVGQEAQRKCEECYNSTFNFCHVCQQMKKGKFYNPRDANGNGRCLACYKRSKKTSSA